MAARGCGYTRRIRDIQFLDSDSRHLAREPIQFTGANRIAARRDDSPAKTGVLADKFQTNSAACTRDENGARRRRRIRHARRAE